MNIEPQFVLSLVGLMVTIGFQTWVIIKFLIKRADDDKKELMARIDRETSTISGEVGKLHEKINTVKDDYIRKDDVEKELGRIYKTLADFKFELTGQLNQMNGRFDNVMNALTARKVV